MEMHRKPEPTTSLAIVSLIIVTNHYDLDFHIEYTNDAEPAAEHAREIAYNANLDLLSHAGSFHYLISYKIIYGSFCWSHELNSHCTNRAVSA